ncbi:probable cysteine--tRNA ligase, mitochondrial [Culicoides brevitarsis]|uniref:probable cysteine--tRNA ligase, mitochondrial n=1 Tax=Culicoides brevitarsis TaxID=469753 RepID=UPI00307C1918
MLFNLRSCFFILHRNFSKWKIPVGTDTVYDSAHIGHASTYVRVDILQRILKKYFHVNLISAMNITDIDDKIIKRALQDQVSFQDVARRYESEFWDDLKLLNVTPPDIKVRVSESMDLIVDFVKQLLAREAAYVANDGSVYFKTKEFSRYGKLQRISDTTITTEDDPMKNHATDFALWKAAKPGEPFWETPWGTGRPGWHIECSAMASFVFGNSIDFHAGGLDLKFPHHENEEAQSCCFHKTDQWVNYWIHTGQLRSTGDQAKMSKSLKNTISVRDLLKTCTSNQFRMLCLLSRYHSAIEFGDETTKSAKAVLHRMTTFIADSRAYVNGEKPLVNFDVENLIQLRQETEQKIIELFKDDFNTPKAIECLLNLISETNRIINSKDTFGDSTGTSNIVIIQDIHNFVVNFLENLGFQLKSTKSVAVERNIEDKLIQSLIDVRQEIRATAIRDKNKSLFVICDKIRQQLLENGIEIKDHGKNTSWKYVEE